MVYVAQGNPHFERVFKVDWQFVRANAALQCEHEQRTTYRHSDHLLSIYRKRNGSRACIPSEEGPPDFMPIPRIEREYASSRGTKHQVSTRRKQAAISVGEVSFQGWRNVFPLLYTCSSIKRADKHGHWFVGSR